MVFFLICFFFVAAVGATFALYPTLHTDGTSAALPARFLIALALTVCAMTTAIRFISGQQASWLVFFVAAILATTGIYRARSRTFLWATKSKFLLTVLLTLGAAILLRAFDFARIEAVVPLEGTGTHDEFWYIFVADFLRFNTLGTNTAYSELHPFYHSASTNIQVLPRVGSELLITFSSIITGYSPEITFPILFILSIFFINIVIFLEILHVYGKSIRSVLSAAIASFSPVILFIYGNMNFSTAFGLVFLGSYYYFIRTALASPFSLSKSTIAGLFAAALIASYPELISVACIATAMVAVEKVFWSKSNTIFEIVKTCIFVLISMIALSFFPIISAVNVFITASNALAAPSDQYNNYINALSWWNSLLFFLTMHTAFLQEKFWIFPSLLASLSLFAAIMCAPFKAWKSMAPMLTACGALTILVLYRGYGYGLMKSVEFASLPLCILFSVGAVACADSALNIFQKETPERRHDDKLTLTLKWGAKFSAGAYALVAFCSISTWIFSYAIYSKDFSQTALQKHLTQNIRDVGNAGELLGRGSVIYISEDLGPFSFMVSRWLAYLMKDAALVFSPAHHDGGYIYGIKDAYQRNSEKITHTLRRRTVGSDQEIIYANEDFEIIRGAPDVLFQNGFYGDEGGRRWMSQTGTIEINSKCAVGLRIKILARFSGVTGPDRLKIRMGFGEQTLHMENGRGEFLVPLRENSEKEIVFASEASARSPAEAGLSSDSRKLTYSIGELKIETNKECDR